MELTPKQQAVEAIKKSNSILIVTGENNKGDGISSALALSFALEKIGKKTLVFKSPSYNPVYFLPKASSISGSLGDSKDFIVSISLKEAKLDKVRYDVLGDSLNFFVSAKDGEFNEQDVSFSHSSNDFDLIIVLDCSDLDHLGDIYENNTDTFYNKPIVNIDHNPANEYYGTINYIDLTASSTAEIMVALIDSLGQGLADADISTCLLAGILVDTNSFQNSRTTPKSLTTTAQLVAQGARHEEVVKMLFKTKTFDVLKMWGIMLSSVETDEQSHVLWTSIKRGDIHYRELSSEVIDGVMDELLSTVPNINIYLLFIESEKGLKTYLRTKSGIDARKISYIFKGKGRGEQGEFFVAGENVEALKQETLSKINQYLEQSHTLS